MSQSKFVWEYYIMMVDIVEDGRKVLLCSAIYFLFTHFSSHYSNTNSLVLHRLCYTIKPLIVIIKRLDTSTIKIIFSVYLILFEVLCGFLMCGIWMRDELRVEYLVPMPFT